MPWTITVLPANPPNVNGSPVRTSVSIVRRIGEGACVAVTTLVGVADGAGGAATTTGGDTVALAAGAGEGLPQATHAATHASERPRAVRTHRC